MKDKKLVSILVLIIVLLLVSGAYLFGRKGNNKKNRVNPSGQFEVPTGPFLNAENDIKPEPLCDANTKPWIKIISPNGEETFNIKSEIVKVDVFEEQPAGKIPVNLKACNVSEDGDIRLMLLDENNNKVNTSMVGSTYGYFNKNSFIPVGSKSGKYKVLVELNDANKIVVTDHPIFSDTSDNFFTINLNNN